MFTVGVGFTVSVNTTLAEQPLALVPVTVYTVVEPGEAFTTEPVVALRPVPGIHE